MYFIILARKKQTTREIMNIKTKMYSVPDQMTEESNQRVTLNVIRTQLNIPD